MIKRKKVLKYLLLAAAAALIVFGVYKKITSPLSQESQPVTQAEADEYYSLALRAYQKGDLKSAQKFYKKALGAGDNELYLEKFAQISYQLNQLDQSLSGYTKLIKLNKDSSSYYNSIGNVYRDAGKTAKAIESYQKAISIDSANIQASINLINLYLLQNDVKKAKEVLVEGLKNNPQNRDLEAVKKNMKL